MTAPKPQQMQSRNERLKISTVRRLRMRSASRADRNERQLDARLAQLHLVARVNAHPLGDPLAVHDRAEVTVIDEHELVTIAHERAMPARYAGETVGERESVRKRRAGHLRNRCGASG